MKGRAALCCWLMVALASLKFPAAFAQQKEAKAEGDQTKRIAELEKSLTNSALVGHFTDSDKPAGVPQQERYELGQVKHLGKDQWLIQARIRYGEHDVPVPLTLPIRWAGDTPVICVDDLTIPGMGTFNARVMIYRDRYAGFWSGKDHGGHLFGTIERNAKNDAAAEKGPTAN